MTIVAMKLWRTNDLKGWLTTIGAGGAERLCTIHSMKAPRLNRNPLAGHPSQ